MSKNVVAWSYIAYLFIYLAFFVGLPFYVVFWRGANANFLWFVALSGFGYSPWRWYGICDGVERPLFKDK